MGDDFLSHFAHELRTLVSSVFACADLLDESLHDRSEARDLVRLIRQNSDHLLKLINNVLDLSKIDAGQLTVERIECDPGQIAAEVVSAMRPAAIERGLNLHAATDGAIPQTIRTDPMRVRQILLNLVDNAIRFTEHGSIRLVVGVDHGQRRSRSSRLWFRVIDTGIGMTSEHQRQMFKPFRQADAWVARRHGGTGLGLPISRRLARLLDGDLTVESKLNEGSTFTVAIPIESSDTARTVNDIPHLTIGSGPKVLLLAKPRHHEDRLAGLRLLVAEDRPESQLLLSVILKGAGARVTLVGTADAIREHLAAASNSGHPFDAILLDTQMPGDDGRALVRHLRQEGCDAPIIALTTQAGTGSCHHWLDAGYTDCIQKPVRPESLVAAVARVTRL